MSDKLNNSSALPVGNGPSHNHAKAIELTTLLVTGFWLTLNGKRRASDCWIWPGRSDNYGYGRIQYQPGGHASSYYLAHRVSWVIHNGVIPPGFLVCHTCDCPGCVNPNHLFLGSNLENIADARAKGRMPDPVRFQLGFFRRRPGAKIGSMHPSAKLTVNNVQVIKELLQGGSPVRDIARQFSVSTTTIYNIRSGRKWAEMDQYMGAR